MANKSINTESVLCNTPVETFKVGEAVHYTFNGDSYPADVIAVSASGKTVTVRLQIGQGQTRKFTFRPKRNRFVASGGDTWTLHKGHHYSQNPSF